MTVIVLAVREDQQMTRKLHWRIIAGQRLACHIHVGGSKPVELASSKYIVRRRLTSQARRRKRIDLRQ